MDFGLKDAIDIILVATLLFYVYRTMKESGTLNIFVGVLAFIVAWVVISEIIGMKLMGTIMDKFMNIGLLILVIIFQDQIKRFLVELGSHKRWRFVRKIFHRHAKNEEDKKWIMPVVYASMNMSKSKTGALIVIQQNMLLDDYERTGDIIDAKINTRLIENIFFKNSPLHDGAMIIGNDRIIAARCTLPISERPGLPARYGMRHKAAVGISERSDADVIVVSEQTGGISFVSAGEVTPVDSSSTLKLLIRGKQKEEEESKK